MAEQKSVKKTKLKDLLSDLASNDSKKKLKAVQGLKSNGDETVIEPLLVVLTNNPSEELTYEITDLLNTIKSTKVPAEIARLLLDKRFVSIRHLLLTTIWNSGLDYRPHLREIVTVAVEGEMMEALECVTIVENIEGELMEAELFEPLIVLTEFIGSNKSEKGPKMDMIKEVTQILQNRNNHL